MTFWILRSWPAACFPACGASIPALALPPYDLLQAIGAKRGMLISGGEVDTERAAKMLVGEFRASKWGRLSLERPPQRAVQEEREEVTDDAPQDDWDDEQ